MSVVVETVNVIRGLGAMHLQFQEYLKQKETFYGDIVHFSKVLWLIRRKCSRRFLELVEEIDSFISLKDKTVDQLSDPNWILDLCFLVDITELLNEIKIKLQGGDKLVIHFCQEIRSFKKQLRTWESQLKVFNYTHFRELNNFYFSDPK